MENVLLMFGDVSKIKLGGADSFSDRLSCKYSVGLLSLFAIIATTRVYIDEPISCWCPAEWTSSQVSYAKKVCWTKNTFRLAVSEVLPETNKHERSREVSYYQWITLILSFQALLFYLPLPIWGMLSRKSGIAVSSITDAAIQCRHNPNPENSVKIVKFMVNIMGNFLFALNRNHLTATRCKGFWTAFYGNYLVIVYIVIKMFYMANSVGQLFLLNLFMGDNYHLYGIDVARRMLNGSEWSTSDRFPRVTLCNLAIRKMGNIQWNTVQCALPMNLFYEMMFIVMWFWLVFVMVVTAFSLLKWIIVSFFIGINGDYIHTQLIRLDKVKSKSKSKPEVNQFVSFFMRRDGCFILNLVSKNAGDLVACELVAGLWDYYKKNGRRMERLRSSSVNNNECPSIDMQMDDLKGVTIGDFVTPLFKSDKML